MQNLKLNIPIISG